MMIEKNFSKFVVFSEDSILNALNKISDNKSRIIFAVSECGVIEGVLTDGDLRRWLVSSPTIDLNAPVSRAANPDFLSVSKKTDPSLIREMLNERITAIPLLDSSHRIVAVATRKELRIEIEGRLIQRDQPAFLIAEIGNNHNGDIALAKQLVDEAVAAGAECAKFQMRDMDALYRNRGKTDDASADLGAQYTLDLLSRFQLEDDQLFQVFDYCREQGIIPLCTPWDLPSLEKLEQYGLQAYKIASADFTHHELIDAMAATGKPLICSTGMATEQEVLEGINHLRASGSQFILLHCNSTYPAPFKDIHLHYMNHLKELGQCLVGYSGHERDINVSIAAVTLGAKVIEKHFTLDREMEGVDHKVSLLPAEFKRMAEAIRQVEGALGGGETGIQERALTQGEMMNREVLAKSLVASMEIPEGTVITQEMLAIKSPGQGVQPNRIGELVGKRAVTHKQAGDFFYPSDLTGATIGARAYQFPREWGVPVRYHDLNEISAMSNMKLLEIHLSYKDMEFDFKEFIDEPRDQGLVVHAPELFAGDHTLDLCALDKQYRKRSISEMQRVIDLTRELSRYFSNTYPTPIVTNVGGFTTQGHIDPKARAALYQILEESLQQLNTEGVEIIPQTMPPFPWHFGGQQYHNLFMDAESIIHFCNKMKMRICLDISHSRLACNHFKWSFSRFLRKVGPYTAHMHLADATGVDGEGIQIGEGEIDWAAFWLIIDEMAPSATFIPEIWQGHKNRGAGAWLALDRLEQSQQSRSDR